MSSFIISLGIFLSPFKIESVGMYKQTGVTNIFINAFLQKLSDGILTEQLLMSTNSGRYILFITISFVEAVCLHVLQNLFLWAFSGQRRVHFSFLLLCCICPIILFLVFEYVYIAASTSPNSYLSGGNVAVFFPSRLTIDSKHSIMSIFCLTRSFPWHFPKY